MTEGEPVSRRWTLLGLGALAALFLLSLYLAWNRIIQVDEAQNVMMARLIAFHRTGEFMASAPLMLLGPVIWIAKGAGSSVDLFHQVRLLFAGWMWVNLVLMVKASGVRLRSREGLFLLLLGATLEPLWDYGFEIRHDNLLLTGVLALWLLLRPLGKPFPKAHLLAGALAVLMQLVAFKAFLYSVPVIGFFLVFPPMPSRDRWRPAIETLAGVVLGLLLGWLFYRVAGAWPLFVESFKVGARFSVGGVERFAPWGTLHRLLLQVPLLVGGALAVLVVPLLRLRGGPRERLRQLFRDPFTPEWIFLVICLAAFLANPTPFPYNLVLLVPPLFIGVLRHRAPLVKAIGESAQGWLLWPLLASAHLLPWLTGTPRHFDLTNERQMRVATLAESLTDPSRHRVFDGSGLVPTRDPIGYHWLIHTFTIRPLSDGTWPSVRSQLADREVPVILPNYRTNWLPEPDQQFIADHYLSLAQDFLLVGARLEKGEGRWMALATGNYLLRLQGAGEAWIEVDGLRVPPGPFHLERGPHRFRFPASQTLTVIWCGPQGQSLPSLENTRQPLFINWY